MVENEGWGKSSVTGLRVHLTCQQSRVMKGFNNGEMLMI